MKKLTIILILLAIFPSVEAQNPILRNLSIDDYNAGTQNWSIDLTDDGRIMFGNNAGLMLFDGDRWSVFEMPNYTIVRSVFFDRDNKLMFVGATDEFGYFHVDPNNFKVVYTSLADRLPLPYRHFGELWRIMRVGSEIAFQSKGTLFIMNSEGKITPYEFSDEINSISTVGNTLYVCCADKIRTYSEGVFSTLPASDVVAGRQIVSVVPYGKDLLFIATSGETFLYDGSDFSRLVMDISPMLAEAGVFSAAISGNMLGFGTVRSGAIIKNLATDETLFANAATGLPNNTVLSMRFDEEENLWLGLDNGISYALLNAPYRKLFGVNNNIGTGYTSLIDGDKLYLGTNQGLYLINQSGNSAASAFNANAISVAGASGQVWNCRHLNGDILLGHNEGAFVVSGATARRIPGLKGTWDFQPLAGTDLLLGCDYDGFFILEKQAGTYRVRNRLEGAGMVSGSFMQDADGSIWLSDWQRGIYRLELSDDFMRVAHSDFYNTETGLPLSRDNLVCRIQGRVYVSSVDGFRTYDPSSGTLVECPWLNAVFDTYGISLRVFETPSGDLLAYKPDYLAIGRRVSDGSYKAEVINHRNMVRRLQMGFGNIGSLDSNHLLLNYDNGFYILDNTFRSADENNHRLMIRSIYSTNDRDTLVYTSGAPIEADKKIVVPHSLNSLRISFVLPEYRDNNPIEYSCFLENYDSEWSNPQTSTSKEYTKLSHGRYTFHVKAHNLVNGADDITSIDIEVLPAWYETWWAKLFYIAAAITVIYLVFKRIKRNAEKELRRVRYEKERQLREQQLQFTVDEEQKEKEIIKLRNGQLEMELKHKSGQLADNALNLIRKNDILNALDADMEELHKSVRSNAVKSEIAKKISDMRRNIRTHMVDDDNWDKFEENFNIVYDNFTRKLTDRYPDLKKIDLKLCVYLRMGLSSKEMASLLNTSVHSIETARYRLRKKLNLESGTNLLDFIGRFE